MRRCILCLNPRGSVCIYCREHVYLVQNRYGEQFLVGTHSGFRHCIGREHYERVGQAPA